MQELKLEHLYSISKGSIPYLDIQSVMQRQVSQVTVQIFDKQGQRFFPQVLAESRDVRGDDHVRQIPQGALLRQRFLLKDILSCPSDEGLLQSFHLFG